MIWERTTTQATMLTTSIQHKDKNSTSTSDSGVKTNRTRTNTKQNKINVNIERKAIDVRHHSVPVYVWILYTIYIR